MFIDWVKGVSLDNRNYMLLFLLGENNTKESIEWFLKNGKASWIKALIANPQCAADPYIRGKIRELIKKRINDACMGEIILPGNFQPMISDPYAMMEHVCGLKVNGLLGDRQFYSAYWNSKGAEIVDLMRSPMTFRSEHTVGQLVKTEEAEYWYRYLNVGVVFNTKDNTVVKLAGADFDRLKTLSK